jgi:hypothetical protein
MSDCTQIFFIDIKNNLHSKNEVTELYNFQEKLCRLTITMDQLMIEALLVLLVVGVLNGIFSISSKDQADNQGTHKVITGQHSKKEKRKLIKLAQPNQMEQLNVQYR